MEGYKFAQLRRIGKLHGIKTNKNGEDLYAELVALGHIIPIMKKAVDPAKLSAHGVRKRRVDPCEKK